MTAPHILITASYQDFSGLGANRRYAMETTDTAAVVVVVAGNTTSDTTNGVVICSLTHKNPTAQIVDSSGSVKYVLKSGSVTGAVWADADAAPITGAKGDPGPAYTVTTTKTSSYTTAADELVQADPTSAGFTITLPAVASGNKGHRITIKNISTSTNTITIARAGSDTIDGGTSTTITTSKGKVTLVSDGTSNWMVL